MEKRSSQMASMTLRAFVVALSVVFASSGGMGCKSDAKGTGSATPNGPAVPVKVQCENLIQTVQQGRAKFDATQDSADFERDTRKSALLLQELRDDIARSGVQDADLKKIATDYQSALSLAAADLNAIAGASKISDDKKFETLTNQFDTHWRVASAVDKKLADYCAKK